MRLLNILTRHFVAGETAEAAIDAARRANSRGMAAILDYLGEDVSSAQDAKSVSDEYMRLLERIHDGEINASVSLKVSQMGILISREECVRNLRRVAETAARLGLLIWLDMEGSFLTQKIIEMFDLLHPDFPNLGLCLQSHLVRTGGDLDRLLRLPSRQAECPLHVRLCKGAYREPSTIAYTAPSALEGNYRMLVQKILDPSARGIEPAFATHDRALIDFIIGVAREKKSRPANSSFKCFTGFKTGFWRP